MNNEQGRDQQVDIITGAAREYWQAARWYLTVALLSKMLRQMLQPRTLKTRAHSTFGNGPGDGEEEASELKPRLFGCKPVSCRLFFSAELYFCIPMRCSLSDSKERQCLPQTPHLGSCTEWYETFMCSTRCSILLYCLKQAAHLFLMIMGDMTLHEVGIHIYVCDHDVWILAFRNIYRIECRRQS